mmetsp:Transcript_9505/g.25275  ORF Transcript_9505/g.25275 Transcript_9505/m.25275 type:complete len:268 (+) Transcript_9505:481-1284(+)
MVEGLPVQLPQYALGLGHHRSGAWAVVEQSQLTEGVPHGALLHLLLGPVLLLLVTIHLALLDDVQAITVIALGDDPHALVDCLLLHSVDDGLLGIGLQAIEQEGLAQHPSDAGLLLLRLRVHGRHEGLALVPHPVRLRGHRGADLLHVRFRRRFCKFLIIVVVIFLLFLVFVPLLVGQLAHLRLQLLHLRLQLPVLRLELLQLVDALGQGGGCRRLGVLGEPLDHEGRQVLWSLHQKLRHEVLQERVHLLLDIFLLALGRLRHPAAG